MAGDPVDARTWQQLDTETDAEYRLFCAYRDLPVENRSPERVARSRSRSIKDVRAIATRNWWATRARAHDLHQLGVLSQAHVDQGAQAQLEVAQLGTKLRSILGERLDTLDPEDIAPAHIAQLLRAAGQEARESIDTGHELASRLPRQAQPLQPFEFVDDEGRDLVALSEEDPQKAGRVVLGEVLAGGKPADRVAAARAVLASGDFEREREDELEAILAEFADLPVDLKQRLAERLAQPGDEDR